MRRTGAAAASAGTLGLLGISSSLLPGRLASANDPTSVHITALVTRSTIIIVAIVAATMIYRTLLRSTTSPKSTETIDAELDEYRNNLGLAIQSLIRSSRDKQAVERTLKLLGEMNVPARFLVAHHEALAALGDRSNGTAPVDVGKLAGLLAGTILPIEAPTKSANS